MTRRPILIPVLAFALATTSGGTGLADDGGWTTLFDGKSLDGWKVNGGTASYKVEGGAIVGTTVEGSPNTFLCKGDYKDFVLELDVKCDPRLNSGVQVRSHVYGKDDPDQENSRRAGVVYGPQCEVARKETGTAGRFYDEGRRGKWLAEISPEAKDSFRDDGWNRYRIVVQGNRYRSWINGVAASDFTDDVDQGGLIGLQVHGIAKGEGPYQVRWRNIRIRELKPGDDASASRHPAGHRVHLDLPYAGMDDERQTLDVYAPTGGQSRPIILWIHGGGWQTGDKASVQIKPQAFVDRGFVFVSTNYRLLPDVDMGTIVRDIARSIRWVHDHIGEYGGDPERILVMGHSAGAQLAALICTDDRYLKAEGLSLSIIKGCVPVDGDTYDVPAIIETAETRRRVHGQPQAKFGHREKFGNDPAKHRDFSAVTHVARGRGIPPFLILHVAEHPDTSAQAQRLADVLKGAGIPARVFGARESTHNKINADLGQPDDPGTKAMFEFAAEALKN
jgi:acetyl esterase/lipase